jgi:ABC-type lipoprotein release transport system permease subunit
LTPKPVIFQKKHQSANDKMLWMIALFILIIACVNFMNLATAQSVNRAKEVGMSQSAWR